MKKLIIFLTISFMFGNDTKELLKMINILNNKDFSYREVSFIYNPFSPKLKSDSTKINNANVHFVETPKTESNIQYSLEVVFQNKVRINSNWYKNGDKLDDYTIIIKGNGVYLKNGKKIISLRNKKSLIKVK